MKTLNRLFLILLSSAFFFLQSGFSADSSSRPRPDPHLPRFVDQLRLGGWHQCIIESGSGLICWGDNRHGQLGTGNRTETTSIVDPVVFARPISDFALGNFHGCLISDSQVFCWGRNIEGQAGTSGDSDILVPTPLLALPVSAKLIAAGGNQSCALMQDDSVWCWGRGIPGRPIGPHKIPGLPKDIRFLAVGGDHACAATFQKILCWGWNGRGQLGSQKSPPTSIEEPVQVEGIHGPIQALALGANHSCAASDKGVYCWGANELGELGDGTRSDRKIATLVSAGDSATHLAGTTKLSAGGAHTCAIAPDATRCWGSNSKGQTFWRTDISGLDSVLAPKRITEIEQAEEIHLGYTSTCLLARHRIRCWGTATDGRKTD